ncbi:RAD55 family ATPase [Helicobacter sp. WB40]|uniref:RAD55 family ATPase n=1 Tax=Helicobacter sp. WB40 TaxID=3004130 RepID=UPI0022EC0C50|nr:ATPase domain-containing protein [Helicobacter sp. WB40]MDA3966640.1 hypothetical protein [Helicobacter sp. WB40]
MKELELEILISFVYYPSDIDNFLEKVNARLFSVQAREILEVILELKDKGVLTLSTLESSLSDKVKSDGYFADMLLSEPNPSYINLAGIFKESYKINLQKDIGKRLLSASATNTLLDLTAFEKELEIDIKEYLNLNEWLEIYKNKKKYPKYKTNMSFFDNALEGGLELGQLVLISGDPEAGKTMFGLQLIEEITHLTKACFFSFEFTIDSYLKRRENSELVNATNLIIINDGYCITEIAENIKALSKKGVKFFLIDSQMRITTPKSNKRDEEDESSKFSILAKLCHSLEIVVLLIIQTSKTDKDTPLGSKKGGHEASIIVRLERVKPKSDDLTERQNEYDSKRRLFLIKKNKQTGKHFKNEIYFNPKSLRFSEQEIKDEIEIVFI